MEKLEYRQVAPKLESRIDVRRKLQMVFRELQDPSALEHPGYVASETTYTNGFSQT